MIWLIEEMRYGDGGLLFGVVLARSHPSSTLYLGIVILCTLINKAWFTYIVVWISDLHEGRLQRPLQRTLPIRAHRPVKPVVD